MIVEKFIRKLKNNDDYKWENKYSSRDLFLIIFNRSRQLIRGWFIKIFLHQSSGLLFVGRHVNIRHKYYISTGKNLIIEDNVCINALSRKGIIIGDNVSIARGCTLICTGVIAQMGEGIVIQSGVGINAGTYLGGQGGITIGEDVIIGPGVKIFSENHIFSDLQIIIKDQGVSRKSVTINRNCWIGANVVILAGVSIGEGCIVAAGSVVNKSMPANMVVGGVPAKVIKSRF